MVTARRAVLVLLLATSALPAADDKKPLNDKVKEIAGTAEFLRSVPKHFATLQAADPARRRVTLLVEGETLAKVWPLAPDAEVKVHGWWGRLDQLRRGDRVWVWFKTDRAKQAVAVSMLADELSEQDVHGAGVAVESVEDKKVAFKPPVGKSRVYTVDAKPDVAKGDRVYVQSAGGKARLILAEAAFAQHRDKQKAALRQRWEREGLPGAVAFLHVFSGELDYMLDHEAMRWGRSLKPGDKVTLRANPPVAAVVKSVKPWRERTQVRLVVNSFDAADLVPGQRLALHMPSPPPDVDAALFPPDLDRPRTPEERVEWFLASMYCTCKVSKDVCTGHFYTLASCNPNGCGMPNAMRQELREKLDKGLTDKQIFEDLLATHGPDLLRPHLLP